MASNIRKVVCGRETYISELRKEGSSEVRNRCTSCFGGAVDGSAEGGLTQCRGLSKVSSAHSAMALIQVSV